MHVFIADRKDTYDLLIKQIQPNRFTNVQIKLPWAKNVGIYGADGGLAALLLAHRLD
jgi:hypothetical protein